MQFKTKFKIWLETENGYVFGDGSFNLLTKIQKYGTLQGAAKELGMSYRHAWGIIKNIEHEIGKPLVKTQKGGSHGGGRSELTVEAKLLMKKYLELLQNLKGADETFEIFEN
jgi:molybdate transport repressor ModE-like protein